MTLSQSKIIFSIILLLGWSVFIAPTFSFQLSDTHHDISMQIIPCHDENCNIQMNTSCTQHCEASQTIVLSMQLLALGFATNNHSLINHIDEFSFIQLVELKPPIHC